MQIFRKKSQLGPQEARFYLEASAWDLPKALEEWREENRWEAEQVRQDDVRQDDVGRGGWLFPLIPRFFWSQAEAAVLEFFVLCSSVGALRAFFRPLRARAFETNCQVACARSLHQSMTFS